MRRLLSVLLLSACAAFVACGPDTATFVAQPKVATPCVKPGQKAQIDLTTIPDASYAYAIVYPDGTAEMKAPAAMAAKVRHVHGTWTVPASMRDGTVNVTVLVTYRTHKASPKVSLEIAKSGVCSS